jgi:hypothetical protein
VSNSEGTLKELFLRQLMVPVGRTAGQKKVGPTLSTLQ